LYERALKLDPGNVNLLRPAVGFLVETGYVEEAVVTAKYVVQRDPTCVMCLNSLSWAYREAGEFDKAVELLQEAAAWSPDRQLIYWSLGSALLQAGRPAEALAAFEKEKMANQGQFGRLMALHDLDRLQEFEDEFARYRADNVGNPEGVARIAAWAGDNDVALEFLEKLVARDGPEVLVGTTTGGFYSRLKQDPRFDAMLRKYGQHPDQREKIPFDFTPPG
jgi:tetratricopeptide (TPR) repeat protein